MSTGRSPTHAAAAEHVSRVCHTTVRRPIRLAITYYGKLQQDGQIEGFDVVLLAPHGGDLNGFVILRGDRKGLAAIRFSEPFERLMARATAIIDSLGVIPAYGGDALAQQMALFGQVADEFGG